MRKIFEKIKSGILYFLWESKKSFFTAFFIVILICILVSAAGFVYVYNNTGVFFKEYCTDEYQQITEPDKIEISFDGKNELTIKKSGFIDLDFEDILLYDNYYNEEYNIVFPADFDKYFEEKTFNFAGEFINFAEVVKNDKGQTVLIVKEKDIFAAETFKNDDEMTIMFKPPEEVYDNIIVIDPGHGGMDFGVNGIKSSEKDVTLKICKRVEDMFMHSKNVKVYLTRNSDDYLQNERRIFFANEYADLFLSVHLCAEDRYRFSDKTNIRYSDNSDNNEPDKEKYAEIMKESLAQNMLLDEINVVEDLSPENENLEVFSIFIELGYNDEFDENNFANNAAYAIYNGIEKIVG